MKERTLSKDYFILILFVFSLVLGGCIISTTPQEDPVFVWPNESKTFKINIFPPCDYAWYLDGEKLDSITENKFDYSPGGSVGKEHILAVEATSLLSSDTYQWNIIDAPALIWKTDSPLKMIYTPALGDDGFLYATAYPTGTGNDQSGIISLNPSDGSIIWGPIIPTGCSYFSGKVSVGANGIVYAEGDWNSCGNGILVAFDSTDGAILWENNGCGSSPHPRQIPALDEELGCLYFGSNNLCSVDMETGINNWSVSGHYYIGEPGTAIDSTGNIYFATATGYADQNPNSRIRSYESNQTFRWEKNYSGVYAFLAGVINNDIILVGYVDDYNNGTYDDLRLIAYDNDGNDLWSVLDFTGHCCCDDAGNIYVGNYCGNTICSFTLNGEPRWCSTLEGAIWVSADFVDNDGHLYARGTNKLCVIDTTTGEVDWYFDADAEFDNACGLTLDPDGHLFFSDSDATLYLLDTNLEYSVSAWPITRYGNRRHTEKSGSILALPK